MSSAVPEGILVKLEDSPIPAPSIHQQTSASSTSTSFTRLTSQQVSSRISSILSSKKNEDDDDPFGLKATSSVRAAASRASMASSSVSTGVLVSIDESPVHLQRGGSTSNCWTTSFSTINRPTTAGDSSLLSLNSSSISDMVFLPSSPPSVDASLVGLNKSIGRISQHNPDWNLLENEAKAVASSVSSVQVSRHGISAASGDKAGLGASNELVDSPLTGHLLVNLDGSLNLLTGLDSPASAEEKQKTPAFVKQLAFSSDGASKNKSSRSTLESAEEIMKKNSPPPPLVAHPEASDENLEPKGGVYIDDQLDRAIRKSLEGVRIQDDVKSKGKEGSLPQRAVGKSPKKVRQPLGNSSALSNESNILGYSSSSAATCSKNSSGIVHQGTPLKKSSTSFGRPTPLKSNASALESSSSSKKRPPGSSGKEVPKRLFAAHKGVPPLKPSKRPGLFASTPMEKQQVAQGASLFASSGDNFSTVSSNSSSMKKPPTRRSLLPDSSTKKRGPPILPSKMITSSASKSDEKVAATNSAAKVPSARRSLLPPGPTRGPPASPVKVPSTRKSLLPGTPSQGATSGVKNKTAIGTPLKKVSAVPPRNVAGTTPSKPTYNSRRSIAGNTSFSYAKVNSSFSSSATPKPKLKPAPPTADRSMLLGATPKMATSAAASATPRVPSVTPSRLSALGATPRPVGGGAARASKLATPSSNFQRQGSFCREASRLETQAATPSTSRIARRSMVPTPSGSTQKPLILSGVRRSLLPQK